MLTSPLRDLLVSYRSGYWGTEEGTKDSNVRVVRNGDIDTHGHIRWDQLPIRGLSFSEISKSEVEAGDILLTTSGDCGYVAFVDASPVDTTCATNFVRILRPNWSLVVPKYLFHWLNRSEFRVSLRPYIRGTTLKNLSVSVALNESRIPLPPLSEQQRIAHILDQAEYLHSARQVTVVDISKLSTSLFGGMFGDPGTNPKAWPVVRLKDAVERVQIGPFGSLLHQSDYTEGGVPVINPMHIANGKIRPNIRHSVAKKHVERLHKYVLHRGDIVMGRRGEMGRCAVVGDKEEGMLCGSGSLIIRPDMGRTAPSFLQALLSSAHFRRRLEHEAQGVTMANLNSTIVEGLWLPLPDIDEQHRFGRFMELLSSLEHRFAESQVAIDQMCALLLHRAFQGEL